MTKIKNVIKNKQDLEEAPLKTLIIGAGAIGLLWYSHFQLNTVKHASTYLYQSPTRKQLPKEIQFTDINNNTHLIPIQSFSYAESLDSIAHSNKPFDILLVCVKSYQLNEAIEEVKSLISPSTIIITSHNGLGALAEQHIRTLNNYTVWNLLTTHGSLKTSKNTIQHTGVGHSDIGNPLRNVNPKPKKHIIKHLNSALPNVVWCHNLLEKQWTKLAINCVINPITAIEDIPNGDILKPEFNQTIHDVIQEIVTLSAYFPLQLNATELKTLVLAVAQKTANNSSSMRCDVNEGRQTEIDYINGYIHRLGIKYGINTKKNTELYQRILAR